MSESRAHAAQQLGMEALAALAAEIFPMACPPGITDEGIAVLVEENPSPERLRTYLDAPLHVVFVHEAGEGLDGYLLMTAGDDFLPDPSFRVTCPPAAYLSRYYVRLNRHGSTISKALLDEAERIAAIDLRVASIWLSINQDNIRTRRFYEKHGFVRVGVKTIPVGDHVCDDYVYGHVLATSRYARGASGVAKPEDAARWMARRARVLRAWQRERVVPVPDPSDADAIPARQPCQATIREIPPGLREGVTSPATWLPADRGWQNWW